VNQLTQQGDTLHWVLVESIRLKFGPSLNLRPNLTSYCSLV